MASAWRTPRLPLGMMLLARYPLPKLPGRAPLEVVVAEGHGQIVTWMHNLQTDGYFEGHYFDPRGYGGCRERTLAAAFSDFQTRVCERLNYICARCNGGEDEPCPNG